MHALLSNNMDFVNMPKEGGIQGKSLMAEWLEQASQWHEMYCYDLDVMSLNLDQVELGVRGTSVLSRT